MSDQNALLWAILEDPADDLRRLVFADWLEEHGDESGRARAEFIRVQIERSHIQPLGPPDQALAYREARLWLALRHLWHPGPLPLATLDDLGAWRRGFPARLTTYTGLFMSQAGAMFAAAPIGQVILTDKRPLEYRWPVRPSWGWFDGSRRLSYGDQERCPAEMDPEELPFALWQAYKRGRQGGQKWQHPDEESALSALSAACVSYGRRQAGLPAL
jgi:uncharacterized protein (TIGR02996 family)